MWIFFFIEPDEDEHNCSENTFKKTVVQRFYEDAQKLDKTD